MARVLLVEDDELLAEMLANVLMDAGHAVGVIANGEDALRSIVARQPDLVVLDGHLPGMHGVNILEQLRLHPELWRMPVLMLTASTGRLDEQIALHAGANAYLRKPCDPDYLLFRVDDMLAFRSQLDDSRRVERRVF